jgi:hypothetical protein
MGEKHKFDFDMDTILSTLVYGRILFPASKLAGVNRNVSRYKDGEAAIRHAAAGFMEAERRFHRVNGHRQIHFFINGLSLLTTCTDSSILTT